MSTDGPVPVSVRQTEDGHFEVVLETPLADGRASMPIDPDAGITGIQIFDRGHTTSALSITGDIRLSPHRSKRTPPH